MRKAVLYVLSLCVVAFYAAGAGAAAGPYIGSVSSFVSNATSRLPVFHVGPRTQTSAHGANATLTSGVDAFAGTPAGTSTPDATPTPIPPTATLTALQKRSLAVQRLAKSSTLPRSRINILVLGSDNDSKNLPGAYPPTQVMMVLSIDPVSNTITELSIPRDSWVHIPGYQYNKAPDGSGSNGWDKIDIASRTGYNNSACTVEQDFGIPIDEWVWVGLYGFIQAIDTMNGVTLDVTHPLVDDTYPDDLNTSDPFAYRRIYVPPGPQHLMGDAALHFVRSRHGDTQGDFGRSQRQQILLQQMRKALLGQDAAGIVALVPDLLSSFKGDIKTSFNVDLPTAARYLSLLRALSHAKIRSIVLQPPIYSSLVTELDTDPAVMQFSNPPGTPFQQSAVLPNWPAINQEIQQVFGAQYFNQDPSHFCSGGQ